MSKPYDTLLKTLIDANADDWVRYLSQQTHLPAGPVEILDSDLSSTLQADRLFRIKTTPPYLLHLELVSGGHLQTAERYMKYNVAARGQSGEPVATVVMLLRPSANPADLTGLYEPKLFDKTYLSFSYFVIKVWERPLAELLAGGLGLIPLAILSNEASQDLDNSLTQCDLALNQQNLPTDLKKEMVNAIFVLSGLRYNEAQISRMYQRLTMTLEDSLSYQFILERGAAIGEHRGVHNTLLRQGKHRFGEPNPETVKAITRITDLPRLERMTDAILVVSSWDELLATL